MDLAALTVWLRNNYCF